jgi:restriction endonuclease S subunit
MQHSIITFKELLIDNDIFRFDADYFHPKSFAFYKDIKSKRFTRIKNNFSVTKLAGFEYTKYFTFENMTTNNSYAVLTSKNIQNEELILDESLKINKKIADEFLNRSKLKKNDIVLSYTGEYRRALVLEEDNLQLGPNICLLRAKNSNISPFYLSTFLNSEAGQLLLEREKTFSAQPTVAMSRIREIPVPLFSENFQNLIEKIVLVAKSNKKEGKSLYSQAEQLLLSELGLLNWEPKHRLSFVKKFSDTNTAGRIDAEYFQLMYEEIVNAIKSSKSHACLGDIVSIKKCIEPGSEAYRDSGIPFLRVSNLSKFGLNSDNQQFISEVLYDSLKAHQPKKGEILLSKDATPGIAYYLKDAPGKMVPSGGILRVTVNDPDSVYPEYLTLVLNSAIAQKQIERDAGGSIINHWLVDQVKNTLIPIFPVLVQKKIAEKVDQSFSDREQSKRLLDIAKRGVEMSIEKNEEEAEKWIYYELDKIGRNL